MDRGEAGGGHPKGRPAISRRGRPAAFGILPLVGFLKKLHITGCVVPGFCWKGWEGHSQEGSDCPHGAHILMGSSASGTSCAASPSETPRQIELLPRQHGPLPPTLCSGPFPAHSSPWVSMGLWLPGGLHKDSLPPPPGTQSVLILGCCTGEPGPDPSTWAFLSGYGYRPRGRQPVKGSTRAGWLVFSSPIPQKQDPISLALLQPRISLSCVPLRRRRLFRTFQHR